MLVGAKDDVLKEAMADILNKIIKYKNDYWKKIKKIKSN
jgi:hypothetical protein